MKIVVTATGNTLDSQLDQRFGRADHFLTVDSDTLELKADNNTASAATGGAGIVSAQAVVETGTQVLITGYVGPNALNVLQAGKITIYKGQSGSVRENIQQFKQGALEKIDAAVPAYSGLGSK